MQCEPGNNEEELPSLVWGLDPVFSAYAKLYIKDILEIKESKHIPGVFFYNSHPVNKVDILGTVVLTRERENYYNYGVDDGTGVINCTCWKNTRPTEGPPSASNSHQSICGGLNIAEQLRKLQELEQRNTKLDIGDVVRVRGQIKIFREKREVVALSYNKVDDPVFAAQIARMLEAPSLYRNVYDKPFQPPQALEDSSHQSNAQGILTMSRLVERLSEKISDFLVQSSIQNFYQRELETVESLAVLASTSIQSFSAGQEVSEMGSTCRQVRSIFREAIQLLQEKGVVFQKTANPDKVYLVTDQDKGLHKVTITIIQEDCKKKKHAEKGCHFLHILACVRQAYSPSVSEAVVQRVLDKLEKDSDIISTMEKRYTAF